MKKIMASVFALVMMLSIATGAMAQTFNLNVPCEAIADNQLYQYHYDSYLEKLSTSGTIQVAHRVSQTSAVETNRIAAYRSETRKTMGVNWHRADYGMYQCMSNAIVQYGNYTVAGRGNTNYKTKYGLNNITLTGYFLTDLD